MRCTLQSRPRTGNRVELSDHRFWAECSDKGLSTQYLRPNLRPIYQESHLDAAAAASLPGQSPLRRSLLKSGSGPRGAVRLAAEVRAPTSARRSRVLAALLEPAPPCPPPPRHSRSVRVSMAGRPRRARSLG